MARDVTEEIRNERTQVRLQAIAATANAASDIEDVLKLVRAALLEEGGFDRVGVWLFQAGALRGAWGTDLHRKLRDEHGSRADPADFAPELDALIREKRPFALRRSPFLDIALPGSDGLAILRQLRVDPRTADLKVAVISNYTDRTIVHDALTLGIVDYIEKASITPSQLPSQVRRWLAR